MDSFVLTLKIIKMKKEDLRIVFMGTPDFAVETLQILVENNYNVVGVVTSPDKPAGRGYQFQPSAVKKYAISKGLHLLQPEKLKDATFLDQLKDLKADVQVVVAFRMLPEVVWSMPAKGTFNVHASLLPQFRGAAPINWAVINGESRTGVTTFFLSHEIDTGDIIFQESIPIEPNDNAGTIHDKLMNLGAQLALKTVQAIQENTIKPKAQSAFYTKPEELKPAPKLFKNNTKIDWSNDGLYIHNFVRGLAPYPAAWTELNANGTLQTFKIYETKFIPSAHNSSVGQIDTDNKTYLRVAVRDGWIEILDIQMSGKKRMKTKDFLNGFSF